MDAAPGSQHCFRDRLTTEIVQALCTESPCCMLSKLKFAVLIFKGYVDLTDLETKMEISILKNALPVGVRAEGTARLESSLWVLLSNEEQCLRATPAAVGGSLGSHRMGLPHWREENLHHNLVLGPQSELLLAVSRDGEFDAATSSLVPHLLRPQSPIFFSLLCVPSGSCCIVIHCWPFDSPPAQSDILGQ